MTKATQQTFLPKQKPYPVDPEQLVVQIGPVGTYTHIDTTVSHGGLFTPAQTARLLGVTRQRVNELLRKKQLPLVQLVCVGPDGKRGVMDPMVPGNAIRRHQEQPKGKGGRGNFAPQMEIADVAA